MAPTELRMQRRGTSARRRPAPGSRRAHAEVLAALGIGGMSGAVGRYTVSVALPTPVHGFPWATFLVNVSGSVVLGFLLVVLLEQFPRSRIAGPLLGSGFLGAFTTFSTFSVEAVQLVRHGRLAGAAAYVAASAAAAILAAAAGVAAARIAMGVERRLRRGAA